jgi:GR25 family glycosyltransferase involved in LPS biosynthesis
MHITAIKKGIVANSTWILVLEDDAVPSEGAFDQIGDLVKGIKPVNTWVNLNSGAGLLRTKSDKKPDRYGLFEVKPASTRCAVAYLITRDLAIKMVELIDQHGVPNWLPIDFIYQALLRKSKAKAYWQDPPLFIQGSEDGSYKSTFEILRMTLKNQNNL